MTSLPFLAYIHILSFFKALKMLQLCRLLETYTLQTCDE